MASIDIDIDDIISGLMSYEKQELADELYESGYAPKQLQDLADRLEKDSNPASYDFDGQVQKLIGNSWRLSKEDEETILRITNKLV